MDKSETSMSTINTEHNIIIVLEPITSEVNNKGVLLQSELQEPAPAETVVPEGHSSHVVDNPPLLNFPPEHLQQDILV